MGQKRVCVISSEIVGPHANGGIGTHCYYLSAFLSQQLRQSVTFLYTGKIERRTEGYWRGWFREHLDIEFVALTPPAAPDTSPVNLRSAFVQTARQVYLWLRQREFDVCYFQEMLGNGFRCFQAKRLGLAFQHTILTCTVHSSWEWICQAMQTFPQSGMEELQTKFMERYCIEHCDQLISPSEYMLSWLERNQVKTPNRKQVLPYLFAPELKPVAARPVTGKIIFFGRLEVRKGLLLFLEALKQLDQSGTFATHPVQVFFLGKSGYTPDGGGSVTIEKFRPAFSSGVDLKPITDRGHRQAMEFLSANNDALVVCPSLVDNSPYAIIESLQLGLNLVAARSGGIPELFTGTERLFEPTVEALAAKLQAGLRNQLPAPIKRYDLQRARKMWQSFCENLATPSISEKKNSACHRPVQVFVSGDASPAVLERTLCSLENQTKQNFSATVLSSSNVPAALEEKCRTHSWAVHRAGSASSAGEARLINAEGGLKVLVGPGCELAPRFLETIASCMSHSGLQALTCCAKVDSGGNGHHGFDYEPLGACLECGFHTNLFGAGCLVLSNNNQASNIKDLLAPEQMWAFLAGLSVAGQDWDICPEPLLNIDPAHFQVSPLALDYAKHLPLLETYCQQAPIWWRYLLLHTVSNERKTLAGEQTPQGDKKHSVAFKLRRETRRLLKQCQSLYRGD